MSRLRTDKSIAGTKEPRESKAITDTFLNISLKYNQEAGKATD
jgi:hypothetical protein